MSRSLDRFVDGVLDDHDLDVDSYAGQRVDEELHSDPTIVSLFDAAGEADHRQSMIRDSVDYDESPRTDLKDARRACKDAAKALADHIVEDTCRATIAGFSVDLRHATRIDCPSCEEDGVEAYYLGSASGDDGPITGWVCGHCAAEVQQYDREDHGEAVRIVEEGDRA